MYLEEKMHEPCSTHHHFSMERPVSLETKLRVGEFEANNRRVQFSFWDRYPSSAKTGEAGIVLT